MTFTLQINMVLEILELLWLLHHLRQVPGPQVSPGHLETLLSVSRLGLQG